MACPACGRPDAAPGHHCPSPAALDLPRRCPACGRRLDVQVLPTTVRATCRRCDGVHPAHRRTGHAPAPAAPPPPGRAPR